MVSVDNRTYQKLLTTPASTKRFYSTLGLPEDAEPEQIHAHFVMFCKAWHPDKHAGVRTDFFAEAERAHHLLMDEKARHLFDSTGLTSDECDKRILDAAELIVEAFEEILSDGHVEEDCDYVWQLRNRFTDLKDSMSYAISDDKKKLSAIKRRRDRIERRWKGKSDFLKKMLLFNLDQKIESTTDSIEEREEAYRNLEFALNLIEQCQYAPDPEVNMYDLRSSFDPRKMTNRVMYPGMY